MFVCVCVISLELNVFKSIKNKQYIYIYVYIYCFWFLLTGLHSRSRNRKIRSHLGRLVSRNEKAFKYYWFHRKPMIFSTRCVAFKIFFNGKPIDSNRRIFRFRHCRCNR